MVSTLITNFIEAPDFHKTLKPLLTEILNDDLKFMPLLKEMTSYPDIEGLKRIFHEALLRGDFQNLPLLKHVAFHTVQGSGRTLGQLVLIHDMSFVERRSSTTRLYILYFFLIVGVIVATVTTLIVWFTWRGWVSGTRALLRSNGLRHPLARGTPSELRPIVHDLRELIRDLETGRQHRDDSQITWTPRSLKELLRKELSGDEIIVVSNREPYLHVKRDDHIEVLTPASGLVTALEPVMRACSGTWVAHGSGSADRETVDANDHVAVPPDHPAYHIRRVWLTEEEEAGYYYGFSNEGLWPLCHSAHVRPTFRTSDWEQYKNVNEKFAKTILQEVKLIMLCNYVADFPIFLTQISIKHNSKWFFPGWEGLFGLNAA